MLSGSEEIFNVSILEKKKTKIHLIESYDGLTLEQFKEKVDKNIPLLLSMEGKGVLHKNVNYTEGDSSEVLLRKVFPSSNIDEFYVQALSGSMVSVIRRDAFDGLLSQISTAGFFVVGAAIGPFVLERISMLLENNEVNTSSYILKFQEGKMLSFVKKESSLGLKINIGGEQVAEKNIVSFASALTYFVNDTSFFQSDILELVKEDFRQKKKFNVRGAAILAGLFIVFFANYLVFDSLQSSNGKLRTQAGTQSESYKQSEVLKTELEEKTNLQKKLGLSGTSRISYYADCIAASLPEEIQLTKLLVNPVEKKVKEEKEIEYDVNQIVVAGKCRKVIYYNEWKKKLSKMSWVKTISVENYTDTDDKIGEFILRISF